jgi:lysophospholipase L1-like esterase
MMPRKRRHRRSRLVLFQFAALAIFLLMLEVVARAVVPRMAGEAMLAHPTPLEELLRDGNNPTLVHDIDCVCAGDGSCSIRGGFRRQTFPCAPAPGVKRFLFQGESSIFGDRLTDDETIPAAVQTAMRQKGLAFEAINGGVSGINLVDVAQVFKGLAPQIHPAALVLYAGHNETYPLHANRNDYAFAIDFPYSRWTMPLYKDLALLRLGVFSYHHFKWRKRPFPARTSAADFVEEAARAVVLTDEQFAQLALHKQMMIAAACNHLERLVWIVERAHVKMLFCPPTSNRLQPAISSTHGPEYRRNEAEWRATAARLRDAMNGGDYPNWLALADRLIALDPHYALSHWLKGMALLKLGRGVESRPCFDQMLEEISIYRGIPEPEGAPPSLARALAETARREGAAVWDAGEAVRGGLSPENDLQIFQDYVHFNPHGARKFAAALADYLEKEGWLK